MPKPKKRNRRLTMQEKRNLMDKLHGKLTPDELEYLNTLVNRQIREACDRGTRHAIATVYGIVFRVLKDKFGMETEQLQSLWHYADDYGNKILSGEISLRDVLLSLRDEDDIVISEDELVEGDGEEGE